LLRALGAPALSADAGVLSGMVFISVLVALYVVD
jgi:hypothetical protein